MGTHDDALCGVCEVKCPCHRTLAAFDPGRLELTSVLGSVSPGPRRGRKNCDASLTPAPVAVHTAVAAAVSQDKGRRS